MYFFTANIANYAGSKPSVKIKAFSASPYTGEAFAAASLLTGIAFLEPRAQRLVFVLQ